jgi:hypothetical protein
MHWNAGVSESYTPRCPTMKLKIEAPPLIRYRTRLDAIILTTAEKAKETTGFIQECVSQNEYYIHYSARET